MLLRADRNGVRDPAFGDQGVWVSPLTNVFRQFVCAGEFAGGLVGVQGRELVAFGDQAGGSGGEALNDPFATSGVLQRDLGGTLSNREAPTTPPTPTCTAPPRTARWWAAAQPTRHRRCGIRRRRGGAGGTAAGEAATPGRARAHRNSGRAADAGHHPPGARLGLRHRPP